MAMGKEQDISESRTYYHATRAGNLRGILEYGFRDRWLDEDGESGESWGILGYGTYICEDFQVCLDRGNALLRLELQKGTRILDTTGEVEKDKIDSLRREFGKEILEKPPWKVLPGNKKLTKSEVITLARYHYQGIYEVGPNRNLYKPSARKRDFRQYRVYDQCRAMLTRYGYHGWGAPNDDAGVVIFSGDRIKIKELVTVIAPEPYEKMYRRSEPTMKPFETIDEARGYFDTYGRPFDKELARKIKDLATD
jgi:hypothetical protein